MESDARLLHIDKFNNNCSTSRARVIGMLHCTFKVYLLAIFSEDELMSDTLIQYCSERESHKACLHAHVRVQINILNFTGLWKRMMFQKYSSNHSSKPIPFGTTVMLPAHIILLTASSYVGLIRHSLTESRPLYVYVHVYCKLMCITETRKSTAHHKCCQILSRRDPDGGLVLRAAPVIF